MNNSPIYYELLKTYGKLSVASNFISYDSGYSQRLYHDSLLNETWWSVSNSSGCTPFTVRYHS